VKNSTLRKKSLFLKMDNIVSQSAWLDGECPNTAPNAIFNFDINNNSTWTTMFAKAKKSNRENCGQGPGKLISNCCVADIEVLDGSLPFEYTRYTSTLITKNDDVVQSAAGHRYCHLQAEGSTSLQNYKDLYVLDIEELFPSGIQMNAIDPIYCVADQIICYNRTLYIFNRKSTRDRCSGAYSQIELGDQLERKTSAAGSNYVQTLVIPKGNSFVEWTTYVPTNLITPYQTVPQPSFFIGTTFLILAIIGTLIVGGFYSYK
jgi:hypothetical protein